jgi:hypothetical protein
MVRRYRSRYPKLGAPTRLYKAMWLSIAGTGGLGRNGQVSKSPSLPFLEGVSTDLRQTPDPYLLVPRFYPTPPWPNLANVPFFVAFDRFFFFFFFVFFRFREAYALRGKRDTNGMTSEFSPVWLHHMPCDRGYSTEHGYVQGFQIPGTSPCRGSISNCFSVRYSWFIIVLCVQYACSTNLIVFLITLLSLVTITLEGSLLDVIRWIQGPQLPISRWWLTHFSLTFDPFCPSGTHCPRYSLLSRTGYPRPDSVRRPVELQDPV